MQFEIKNIEPMGAVRMTKRSKYKDEYAQKYLNYKKIIYYEILKQLDHVYKPIDAAIGVKILFKMPIPASWTIKQKQDSIGQYHTKKSDIDNLCKGLFDAVNGLVWIDDNRVAKMEVTKIYSVEPGIVFDVESIGGLSHGQAATKTKEKTQQTRKRKTAGGTGKRI